MKPLSVELIPSTAWGQNLRMALTGSQWKKLRKQELEKHQYTCECCGLEKPRMALHEEWEWDEQAPGGPVQRLVGLLCLCPDCHEVKHIGLARTRGRGLQAFLHLMLVNRWSEERALAHLQWADTQWERRSRLRWNLDVSYLDEVSSTL